MVRHSSLSPVCTTIYVLLTNRLAPKAFVSLVDSRFPHQPRIHLDAGFFVRCGWRDLRLGSVKTLEKTPPPQGANFTFATLSSSHFPKSQFAL